MIQAWSMNQASLLTIGKKLGGSDLYLVSVFDVEPSGVIVQAYNQVDSREYILPISEVDVSDSLNWFCTYFMNFNLFHPILHPTVL